MFRNFELHGVEFIQNLQIPKIFGSDSKLTTQENLLESACNVALEESGELVPIMDFRNCFGNGRPLRDDEASCAGHIQVRNITFLATGELLQGFGFACPHW